MTRDSRSARPTFALEEKAQSPVCGVDEAGRGPLAGPVVAAAVILDSCNLPDGINDSKKLTAAARERLFDDICASAEVGIGQASEKEIGTFNILGATLLAMRRAVASLPHVPAFALIDGNKLPNLPCPAMTVIRGDTISLSIAAASIVAKVTRDRIMCKIADQYPGYGFERHMGYGTAAHLAALNRLGVTPHHRLDFAPVKSVYNSSKSLNLKKY